jgi:type II secretory pathway component PulJ
MTRLCTERGASLIDALVATTVFAIVAAGGAAGTIATVRSNAASRDVTAAAALIHDKIEQLRALDPTANPADLRAGTHPDPLNPITELGQQGGIFTRSWSVTVNAPRTGLARVTITVSWKDPRSRTLTSATYLCLSTTCS